MTDPLPPPPTGWYQDHLGRFELRYVRAGTATEYVQNGGVVGCDPRLSNALPPPPPRTLPASTGTRVTSSGPSSQPIPLLALLLIPTAIAVALFINAVDGPSGEVNPTLIVVSIGLILGAIGAAVGNSRRVGAAGGFALGLLLGPVGILIAAAGGDSRMIDRLQSRPAFGGWYADPLGRFDSRYFGGRRWTQHVGRVEPNGVRRQFEDPI